MTERSGQEDPSQRGGPHTSDERDELRTISFRLREIQRLLGARVTQENRRLEAAGIEPVTDHDFFHPEDEREEGRTRRD